MRFQSAAWRGTWDVITEGKIEEELPLIREREGKLMIMYVLYVCVGETQVTPPHYEQLTASDVDQIVLAGLVCGCRLFLRISLWPQSSLSSLICQLTSHNAMDFILAQKNI